MGREDYPAPEIGGIVRDVFRVRLIGTAIFIDVCLKVLTADADQSISDEFRRMSMSRTIGGHGDLGVEFFHEVDVRRRRLAPVMVD